MQRVFGRRGTPSSHATPSTTNPGVAKDDSRVRTGTHGYSRVLSGTTPHRSLRGRQHARSGGSAQRRGDGVLRTVGFTCAEESAEACTAQAATALLRQLPTRAMERKARLALRRGRRVGTDQVRAAAQRKVRRKRTYCCRNESSLTPAGGAVPLRRTARREYSRVLTGCSLPT
jgi:hypothetical protein